MIVELRNRLGWYIWINRSDDGCFFWMIEDAKQMPIGFAREPIVVTTLPIRRFSTQQVYKTLTVEEILDGAYIEEVVRDATVQGDLFDAEVSAVSRARWQTEAPAA